MTRFFLLVSAAAVIAGCASTQPPAPSANAPAPTSNSSATVTQRAEQILSGSARAPDWQQTLLADLTRHLEQSGAMESGRGPSPAGYLLAELSARPPNDSSSHALVGPLTSALAADRVVVVCREGEFDTLESCVVVCLGDLRARSVKNCVLFVSGHIEADQIDTATICGGGTLDVRTTQRLTRAPSNVGSPGTR